MLSSYMPQAPAALPSVKISKSYMCGYVVDLNMVEESSGECL
jgi:hypothetical protein